MSTLSLCLFDYPFYMNRYIQQLITGELVFILLLNIGLDFLRAFIRAMILFFHRLE